MFKLRSFLSTIQDIHPLRYSVPSLPMEPRWTVDDPKVSQPNFNAKITKQGEKGLPHTGLALPEHIGLLSAIVFFSIFFQRMEMNE